MCRIRVCSLPGRNQWVGPSAMAAEGGTFGPDWQPVAFPVPRALELGELAGIVEQFRAAARNAQEAGFDGVEIHGGNSYLLDQFLQSGANQRTDAYGGTPENRSRLLLQVVGAVCEVWRTSKRRRAHLQFRKFFTGPLIAAGGFTGATATAMLDSGIADAIGFGRHFVANPDLPARLSVGAPLNPYDRATFYGDATGYTDYPFLADLRAG